MKLINRKTRKAIEKSVRKAMKKHGPALMAGLASGLASSFATLAKTEAPGKHGRSNLTQLVEDVGETLAGNGHKKSKGRAVEKKRRRHKVGRSQPSQPVEATQET